MLARQFACVPVRRHAHMNACTACNAFQHNAAPHIPRTPCIPHNATQHNALALCEVWAPHEVVDRAWWIRADPSPASRRHVPCLPPVQCQNLLVYCLRVLPPEGQMFFAKTKTKKELFMTRYRPPKSSTRSTAHGHPPSASTPAQRHHIGPVPPHRASAATSAQCQEKCVRGTGRHYLLSTQLRCHRC